jgi:hypothetical protein
MKMNYTMWIIKCGSGVGINQIFRDKNKIRRFRWGECRKDFVGIRIRR